MPATDDYAGIFPSGLGAYRNMAAVTPHDTNELANVTRALFISVGGTVKVTMIGTGTGVTFTAISGQIVPIACKIVFAIGTTATGIVALW